MGADIKLDGNSIELVGLPIVGIGDRLTVPVEGEGHGLVRLASVVVKQLLTLAFRLSMMVYMKLFLEVALSAAAAADAGGDENREEGHSRDDNHGDEPPLHRAVPVDSVEGIVVLGDVARATRALRAVVAVLEGTAIRRSPVVVGACLCARDQNRCEQESG